MPIHSTIPAWKMPWTEKPEWLQSIRSQRIGPTEVTQQAWIVQNSTESQSNIVQCGPQVSEYLYQLLKGVQVKIFMYIKTQLSLGRGPWIFTTIGLHRLCNICLNHSSVKIQLQGRCVRELVDPPKLSNICSQGRSFSHCTSHRMTQEELNCFVKS